MDWSSTCTTLYTVKLDECIDPSRSSAGQVKGRKVVELETLQPTVLDAWALGVKPLEEDSNNINVRYFIAIALPRGPPGFTTLGT